MESSLIINEASVKKCSAQACLPGSLKPCAETLACEDVFSGHSVSSPIKNTERVLKYGHLVGQSWFRSGWASLLCTEMAAGLYASRGAEMVTE